MADGDETAGAAAFDGCERLLSERLLAVLTREMDGLEAASKEIKPNLEADAVAGGVTGVVSAGAKGRIEAVGQMTRTLEKLLELKRLEALAMRGDEDEDGEAARLRDELLKRLRALDARRRGGPTLFDADGRYAGEAVPAAAPAVGEGAPVLGNDAAAG